MKKISGVLLSALMLIPALAFADTAGAGTSGIPVNRTNIRQTITRPGAAGALIIHTVNASTALVNAISGTVVSVSGQSINLTGSSSASFTVDATNAKIYRKYGAVMAITDIAAGDKLAVRGTISGTNLAATYIRDNSQQQVNATFSGTVSSVGGSSFVLATKQRGNQTINTSSATVFKESGLTSVSFGNVTAGENITATGIWDSTNKTVAASKVTIVVRNGTITGVYQSISGQIISMTAKNSSSTVYSVDATQAKLIRRYGAAMQLSDIQAGDLLAVSGIINVKNILAKTIRNESLQAHNGTFVGTVGAVNGGSFTLLSKARGSQTINTTSATIFRQGTASTSLSGIASGQTVTVTGVWDRTNSNVTATRVTIKVNTLSFTGTLGPISGSVLSVTTASSTTYSVDSTNARITYKNGHKGSLAILQTGDSLSVYGKAVSGSTNVIASLIRDTARIFTPTTTPQQ